MKWLNNLGVGILLLIIMPATGLAASGFGERCASDATFVTSLYRSILKREPDATGERNWRESLKNGMQREDVIRRFFDSPEYVGKKRNNTDYARDLYAAVLGRNPDSGGHSFWVQKMDHGMSRAEVLQRFYESEEYQRLVNSCSGSQGGSYTLRCADDKEFVTSLYRSILKREPDRDGRNHWVNSLRGDMNREQVITSFFNSTEYQAFGRSNRDYVQDLYNGVLGREPDSQGHAYWIGALDGGKSREQVLWGFIGSPEYKKLRRCR